MLLLKNLTRAVHLRLRASSVEDGIFVRSSITAIGTIIGGLAACQAHEEETKCSQQPYNHIERL